MLIGKLFLYFSSFLVQAEKKEEEKKKKKRKKEDIYTNNDINYNYDFNKPRLQTINVSWCSVCIHYGMNEPASGKQNLHLNYHPGNTQYNTIVILTQNTLIQSNT